MLPSARGAGSESLALGWLVLATAAVAASSLFAILIVFARVPGLGALFPGTEFYRVALTLHVNLSQWVWFMAFAAVLWSLGLVRTPGRWHWFALALAAAGALLMALSPALGAIRPLMANYLPVLDSPWFFAGLGAYGLAVLAVGQQVAHTRRSPVAGWQDAYDVEIEGEPEEALLAFLPQLLAGVPLAAVESLSDEVHVAKPDDLPSPIFTREEMEAFAFPFPLRGRPLQRWAYVLSARGCPHRCRHCSVVVRKSAGGRLRCRDPRRIADEVAAHVDAGAEAIAFEDDTLLVDKRHFLALCGELTRRGLVLPWIANARPDELDEDRVAAAAETGATLLKLGIETGSPRLIEAMGKCRHGESWRIQTEAGLARLQARGVGALGLFLVGLPTQTAEEVAETWRWSQALGLDYVQVQIFRAYPDIAWWPDMPVDYRDVDAAYHYGPIAATTAAMPASALPVLQRRFYRGFYLRPQFALSHLRRCWRHYCDPRGLLPGLRRLAYLAGTEAAGSRNSEGVPGAA